MSDRTGQQLGNYRRSTPIAGILMLWMRWRGCPMAALMGIASGSGDTTVQVWEAV